MANAIRALAMDAVEQANSGHPGLPMGAADIATVLFTRFLKFDPADPAWPDRDRFVLSAGHGSMLLYALFYLLGYEKMTIAEIKRFRQFGSLTPGHPEHGHTPGVETTTGPLGQGLGNAVGMAIAERHLAALFGAIVDHTTYVLCSDGDLMEGISQEAIALAGHLKLNKLIVLYDDNRISIDGPTRCPTRSIRSSVSSPPAGRRPGSTATIRRRSRSHRGGAKIRSSVDDRLPHHHRFRRAEKRRHREEPRRGARLSRDRCHPPEARLDFAAVRNPRRYSCRLALRRRARPPGAARLGARIAALEPETARRVQTADQRRPAEQARRRGRRVESKNSPTRRRKSPPGRRPNWRSKR